MSYIETQSKKRRREEEREDDKKRQKIEGSKIKKQTPASYNPDETKKRKRSVLEEEEKAEPQRVIKKRRILVIQQTTTLNWNEWVTATQTRNYLIKDPIIDWLSFHGPTLAASQPKLSSHVLKALSGRVPNNFAEFIKDQGVQFEKSFMDFLYAKLKDMIINIGGADAPRSPEKVQETIVAMNKGIPVIYNGVLHNPDNKTYGVPDLLVRSDWLEKITTISPIASEYAQESATRLRDINHPHRLPKYHYRVIDIKYTTLYLAADGVHLLNVGSFPAYKGQLWVYNKALARIQGYEPRNAYILGRKWTFKSQGQIFRGASCIDRLGVVDFADRDIEYVGKTLDAIKWIRKMRADGKNWDLFKTPLPCKELYPNMSNTHDQPWHQVKVEIAKSIKEITDLWMCGVKNRELAHSQKVYRWTDPKCNASVLGIKGQRAPTLDAIIAINHQDTDLIRPAKLMQNHENWKQKQSIEFYIDFEYINDVLSDFSKMPIVDSPQIIFMIGVGYFEPISGDWVYREFTVNSIGASEEKRICEEFSQYIINESEWYECVDPLLIHWSHAEKTHWANAYERHNGIERAWIPAIKTELKPRWFDMLDVFKKEPIVIKGCLSFGLKEVATAMAEHGFIKTVWDQTSSCVDGTGAMLGAYRASIDAKSRGLSLKDMPQMQEIKKYNEVDCKALGEIVEYLRKNH